MNKSTFVLRRTAYQKEKSLRNHRIKMVATVVGLWILVFALFGCAPMPTLDELETKALVTGDWTLVERREARIAKKQAKDTVASACNANNMFLLCDERKELCWCSNNLNNIF